jgi:hypothetical protein
MTDRFGAHDDYQWTRDHGLLDHGQIETLVAAEARQTRKGSIIEPEGERSPLKAGYRNCTKCGCQQFEGNAGTCANNGCGHAFEDHW